MKLDNLTEYQQRGLLRILQRDILLDSFYEFFLYFWPVFNADQLRDNFHIRELCAELQDVGLRIINREAKEYDLLINQPPGTTKSSLVSIAFPAWLWAHDPTLRIISCTYEGTLARRQAESSKAIINSPEYQELFGDRVRISKTESGKSFYKSTAGGFRMATSTGANITGNHAHVIIVDDPSNPKVALSKAMAGAVMYFLDQALSNRKADMRVTPTIMTMQRLNQDDPAGTWIKRAEAGEMKLKHICLPATCIEYPVKPAHLAAQYQGGYLDPVRLGEQTLKTQKALMGTAMYAGQYGQQPADPEGNLIKRAWIKFAKPWELPSGIVWHMFVDGAYTKTETNSPTGIELWGYHPGTNTAYLRYARLVHMELPALLKEVIRIAEEFQLGSSSKVWVEPKATGKSLIQLLREVRTFYPVPKEIKGHLVQEGKPARANELAARMEAGNVTLVQGNWNDSYVDQVTAYPQSATTEHTDCGGYACAEFFGTRKAAKARRTN